MYHSYVKGFRRIVYSVYQYHELLDSSNMCMRDWKTIAEDIWVSPNIYMNIYDTVENWFRYELLLHGFVMS